MKKTLSKLLTDTNSKAYYVVNDLIALVTVVSIVVIVIETLPSLALYKNVFTALEWFTVAIFSTEYIARLYVSKKKFSYVFSFYGFIDILAILPSFIGVGNFTFVKSARSIRLIRLLRVIRLAKLKSLKSGNKKAQRSFLLVNLMLVFTVALLSSLLIGILMYLVEGDVDAFSNIPKAMLWSFKMFLLGLPIEMPTTGLGQFVHIFGRLVGLTVFGVIIGVTGSFIKEYLFSGK